MPNGLCKELTILNLKILQVGDPRLRQHCKPIEQVTPELRSLAARMIETMRAHDGVGLAAPQVGSNLRLIVVEVPGELEGREPDWNNTQLLILLNPEVREMTDFCKVREGCLSLPGYITFVNRAHTITAMASTMDDQQIIINAEGLMAQAIQHEVNHLDGILIQDHIRSIKDLVKIIPSWLGGEERNRRDSMETVSD